MLFRFRFAVSGGHTHVRVFSGKGIFSLAKCGELVFRNEEFEVFRDEVRRRQTPAVEILPEDRICHDETPKPKEVEDALRDLVAVLVPAKGKLLSTVDAKRFLEDREKALDAAEDVVRRLRESS